MLIYFIISFGMHFATGESEERVFPPRGPRRNPLFAKGEVFPMQAPQKIALLGFDCALTSLVRKHIAEGICPNFQKVFAHGTVAENCFVPYPTITPPNWTCMATGAWPGTNGITDFWRAIPGETPMGANTHNCFNWDHVRAESIWEAAEKAGKKSVILNYPMSYNVHKKLKHGVVVGGGALTTGVYMDSTVVADIKGVRRTPDLGTFYAFCDDLLVCSDPYPGNTARVSFQEATNWTNVDNMGDDPLQADFVQPFANSMFDAKPVTWHLLVRDLGRGYDTVTLSPTTDFQDAFFTIKTGEWAPAFDAEGPLADGTVRKLRMKAKLVSLDEDNASGFRLLLPHALNKDGGLWCFPPDKAAALNTGDNISTNNTGMFGLSMNWIDLDTWMEIIGIHYDWLGDAAEALLKNGDWDIFYSHAHPTDYIYHVLMTELDPDTCTSRQAHEKAWECHRALYRHADRYLGRLLALFDDETLVTLISDHGATPDGPRMNTLKVMEEAGLTTMKELVMPEWAQEMPANIRASFAALAQEVDAARSRALPERCCYVYVNLKGRDPEGIVEPEDYEKVQRAIIHALLDYVEPTTGERPVCLALTKRDAQILGLWGDQCGDVVYAVWPEFQAQHGSILPTAAYGIGDLRPLCVFYGPRIGIKQGYSMERRCNLVDLVPTYCYLTGWPLPATVEGSVIYQIMDDPSFRPMPPTI